jgi:hypothetical protein
LAPFSACEVLSSSLRDNIIGPSENGGLGGIFVSFSCEYVPVFDLNETGFDGGRWVPLCSHAGHIVFQLFFCDLAVRVVEMGEKLDAGHVPKPCDWVFLAARNMPGTAAMMRLRSAASTLCQIMNSRRRALCCRFSSTISATIALSLWTGTYCGFTGGSKATLPLLRETQ